jgi:hypothetical protein
MFSHAQLEGILLSMAKPEIHISRANNTQLGYRVRVRVNFRGSKDFIYGLQRTLNQKGIDCSAKDFEHKSRPRPILTVGGMVNLWKLCKLVPDLPDAKNAWPTFKKVVEIIDNGEHHTLQGLDKILQLKGEI